MKKKVEVLLLAGIIIAAFAYLMLRETDRTRYALPKLPDVPRISLNQVEIATGGKTVSLIKKDDRWFILPGDFPADKEKVEGILDSAAKLSLAARVSESQNYARYALDDNKKIHVKAVSDDTIKRDFDIGSTASTFRHTHVRISGDPNVYLALGNFKSKFDHTVEGLRDLTVLSFLTETVHELTMKLNDTSVKIIKKFRAEKKPEEKADTPNQDTVYWETEGGKSVDAARFKGLLSTLSGLKCQKYMEGNDKNGFKDPEVEITVKGDKEHVLRLFKKTDKDAKEQPGISSDNAYPFFLADHQFKDLRSFVENLTQVK